MTRRQAENYTRTLDRLRDLGLSHADAAALFRIERTLQRWGELECGDGNDYASWSIERDENTERPYLVTHPHQGKTYRTPVRDRERGALRRLAAILKPHARRLWAYHQGDPRGAALYIGKRSELRRRWPQENRDGKHGYTPTDPSAVYSSVGVAVCY